MIIYNSKLVILYKFWSLFTSAMFIQLYCNIHMQLCIVILTIILNEQHIKFKCLLWNTDSNVQWLFMQGNFTQWVTGKWHTFIPSRPDGP
jgi:hypothetical protein